MTSQCAGTVQMREESESGIKPKIHYASFPVTSPYTQGRCQLAANLLRTCGLCCGQEADLLRTCTGKWGETGVMDFEHKKARRDVI